MKRCDPQRPWAYNELRSLLSVWASAFVLCSTSVALHAQIRWAYDEAFLLQNTRTAFEGASVVFDLSAEDSPERQEIRYGRHFRIQALGWCIVAWGEYSNGSKESAELFKKIESKFGDIAVPAYICFKDRFLRNVTPYCFSTREPSEPVPNLGAVPPASPTPLSELIEMARSRIEARSGFSFAADQDKKLKENSEKDKTDAKK